MPILESCFYTAVVYSSIYLCYYIQSDLLSSKLISFFLDSNFCSLFKVINISIVAFHLFLKLDCPSSFIMTSCRDNYLQMSVRFIITFLMEVDFISHTYCDTFSAVVLFFSRVCWVAYRYLRLIYRSDWCNYYLQVVSVLVLRILSQILLKSIPCHVTTLSGLTPSTVFSRKFCESSCLTLQGKASFAILFYLRHYSQTV